MHKEFQQIVWDDSCREALAGLLHLAVREDLDRWYDWTTLALVSEGTPGAAAVVARKPGVVAGLAAAEQICHRYGSQLAWEPLTTDGQPVDAGQEVGRVAGPARALLAAERVLLNFLGRMSGVATLTAAYVRAVEGTRARVYDTRKTLPGHRLLDKYAVRCGGGWNHRLGLHASILIKDNHLALGAPGQAKGFSPREAVERCRKYIEQVLPEAARQQFLIEVEVDSLLQLEGVLVALPDVVLLDNMTAGELCEAVARRDALAPQVELEASGGVALDTIGQLARTGVERISVGALTHSASWFDLGLDWR